MKQTADRKQEVYREGWNLFYIADHSLEYTHTNCNGSLIRFEKKNIQLKFTV